MRESFETFELRKSARKKGAAFGSLNEWQYSS